MRSSACGVVGSGGDGVAACVRAMAGAHIIVHGVSSAHAEEFADGEQRLIIAQILIMEDQD